MRKLICIISMALNLVLLAFIFFPQSPIIVREAAPESSPVWRRPRVEKLQVARATNVVDGILHWSQVESSDYAIYISNLRAIGCPKQTIRDIVMADVEDLFAQRRLELVKDPVQRFWDLVVDEKAMEKVVDESRADCGICTVRKRSCSKSFLGLVTRGNRFTKIIMLWEVDLAFYLQKSVSKSLRFAKASLRNGSKFNR